MGRNYTRAHWSSIPELETNIGTLKDVSPKGLIKHCRCNRLFSQEMAILLKLKVCKLGAKATACMTLWSENSKYHVILCDVTLDVVSLFG